MSRQAKRMPKNFVWSLNKTWWGYLLDPVICEACNGTGADLCPTCEGEGKCYPKVEIPGYNVDSLPSWWREDNEFLGGGYGWQMWETTSEGSPISPVLDSPEELAQWLADNNASAFGRDGATYEQWLAMIGHGWAPSAIIYPTTGKIISGIEGGEES